MTSPAIDRRAAHSRRLLSEEVFRALCDQLVDGRLEPGQQLRDDDLGRFFGVSRTPIREALLRLIRAGLVETSPNRFTRVTPVLDSELVPALNVLADLLDSLLCRRQMSAADLIELTYRVDTARQDDAVAVLWAVIGFLVERDGSVVVAQVAEITVPRLMRVLRHRPDVLGSAGGMPGLRRWIHQIAHDVPAARKTLRRVFASISDQIS